MSVHSLILAAAIATGIAPATSANESPAPATSASAPAVTPKITDYNPVAENAARAIGRQFADEQLKGADPAHKPGLMHIGMMSALAFDHIPEKFRCAAARVSASETPSVIDDLNNSTAPMGKELAERVQAAKAVALNYIRTHGCKGPAP